MIKTTNKEYEDINSSKYLSRSSFLKLFPILNDNGEHVYNIFRPYIPNKTIFTDRNFDYTILSNGEWWENIAYDYYNNENLWWVLCITNKIVNPFEEINETDIVYELKQNFLNILYSDIEKIRNL